MVHLAIWWATWKERSRRIFEDKVLSFQDFKFCDNKDLNLLAFVDYIMDESLRA